MNPRKSVGTAYLAYSGRLLAEIAQALGKAEDAVQYRDTAEKARLAYRAAFTDNGKITSDRQCEYVRAIAFALLGQEESQAAADDAANDEDAAGQDTADDDANATGDDAEESNIASSQTGGAMNDAAMVGVGGIAGILTAAASPPSHN